jgi:hypothetical protein
VKGERRLVGFCALVYDTWKRCSLCVNSILQENKRGIDLKNYWTRGLAGSYFVIDAFVSLY